MQISSTVCGSQIGSKLTGVGRVIGVYSKAVNIHLTSDLCLCIVTDVVDQAPNRAVVSSNDFERLPLTVGDHVRVTAEAIYHRLVTIDFSERVKIDPVRSSVSVADFVPETLRQVLQGGRGAALPYLGLPGGDSIDQLVAEQIKRFARRQDAVNLIGLGKGLTPAGDDILTGYLAVGQRTGLLDEAWCHKLIEKARFLTNPLSYTALYFAGLGLAQGYLDTVLNELDTTAEKLFDSGIRLINKVGSTSGSDLLLGVLIYCEQLCRDKRVN